MAEQGFKISTIDDLVKDLVRQQGTPSSPQSQPTGGQVFKAGQEPPLQSPPAYKPQIPATPQPQPQKDTKLTPPLPTLQGSPASRGPFERPKIQEYQSTIRTLADDLRRLKLGQKVDDVEIQKRILSGNPPIDIPSPAKGKSASEQETINVGGSTAAIIKSLKDQIKKDTPPAPPSNGKTQLPRINLPIGSFKNLFMGYKGLLPVGIIALLAIGVYIYFNFFNGGTTEPTPAPSATVTASQPVIPRVKSLNEILGNMEEIVVNIPRTGNPSDVLYSSLTSAVISRGAMKKLRIIETETDQDYNVIAIFDRFFVNYPPTIKETLGDESTILLYGQTENYTAGGQIINSEEASKKIIILSEIKDVSRINSVLLSWEPNMIDGLTNLLKLSSQEVSSPTFLDNTYKGVNIRYRNFKFPDKSIDYAVIMSANNKKSYLVISNSREAMYAILDRLQ